MAEADQFIGATVLVRLYSPPDAHIRGVVISISNQMLYLREVFWLPSGHRTPTLDIESSNILDLEVLPENLHEVQAEPRSARHGLHRVSISPPLLEVDDSVPSSLRGSFSQQHTPLPSTTPRSHGPSGSNVPSALDDPAILSLSRPPTSAQQLPHIISPNDDPVPYIAEVSPALAHTPIERRHNLQRPALAFVRNDSVATATLSEPFDDLSIEKSQEEPESEAAELGTDGGMQPVRLSQNIGQNGKATKNSRRGTRGKARKSGRMPATLPPHVEEADSSPIQVKKTVQILRRKTLKPETPLAEADSFGIEDESILRKSKQRGKPTRKDKAKVTEATNGWATEDATDIQELGDFDFEANHAKFDKKEVFKQLRQDDTTAEEMRLVSHNRKPKAGTRGGRDLHWSENVLEAPHVVSNGVAKWTSEAGESEDEVDEAKMSSGRDSRRAASRQSTLRAPSRKSSHNKGAELHGSAEARTVLTNITNSLRSPADGLLSPRAKSQPSTSPYLASLPASRPLLRIEGSNKPCPTLNPLQMLEFEQFAVTELDLTEDIISENAARGIAETAIKVLRSSNKNANVLRSHVVVAAGNHRTGARALAAARHLHCHGLKITATVMGGSDHEEELLDSVVQQLSALRKAGGNVVRPAALLAGIKESRVLPNLMVDALLGIHLIFDDLRGDDQAWYYELVLLVNRNEWKVLSVDVPSGLDAQTATVQHTDSTPSQALAFFPAAVVSLGAPKSWILAMFRDVPPSSDSELALYVADIGISNLVWKRLGNRKSKGVEFAGEWVRGLQYQAGRE